MADGYGLALINSGNDHNKPAVRIGRKIDDIDITGTMKAVQDAAVAATQRQSDQLKKNDEVTTPAVNALQQMVSDLETLALSLSNGHVVRSGVQNSFKDLQINTITQSGYSASNYVDITVNNTFAKAASPQSFRVLQIAAQDKRVSTASVNEITYSNPVADVNTPLGLTGIFVINGGTPITVNPTDALSDIITEINSSSSNVTASTISEDGNFYLIITDDNPLTPFTLDSDPQSVFATVYSNPTPTPIANVTDSLGLTGTFTINGGGGHNFGYRRYINRCD